MPNRPVRTVVDLYPPGTRLRVHRVATGTDLVGTVAAHRAPFGRAPYALLVPDDAPNADTLVRVPHGQLVPPLVEVLPPDTPDPDAVDVLAEQVHAGRRAAEATAAAIGAVVAPASFEAALIASAADDPRCTATTAKGDPCRNRPRPNTDRCANHTPRT